MKTTVCALLLTTLSFGSTVLAQTPPAARTVSPSASEILLSMAQDSKRLRAEFREILLGHNPAIPPSDVLKGIFKLKVEKVLTPVTDRKTVVTILPSTSVTGFALDPAANHLAKLLQGDGGASGAAFYGLDTFTYPDVSVTAGMTAATWRASDTATRPIAKLDALVSWCTTEKANPARLFWFEIFPLHLHCRTVSLLNLEAYKASLDVGTAPGTSTDITTFLSYNAAVNGLGVELATGAAILQAQKYVAANSGENPGAATDSPAYSSANEFLKNKARCFPVDGKPYIKTVMGSFLMPFDQTASTSGSLTNTMVKIKAPQTMAHPEPGYAIGTFARYNVNDVAHNLAIVANNYVNQDPKNPPAPAAAGAAIDYSSLMSGFSATSSNIPMSSIESSAIVIDNKTYQSFSFNGEGVLHFNFNVRDVHSPSSSPTCTFFCAEPRRSAPQTFIDRVSTDITRDAAWFRPGS